MKYICSVCGYVYDEAKEPVPFRDLPDTWVCPLCRAGKAMFRPDAAQSPPEKAAPAPLELDGDMHALSPGALAALFSNLARGCEKQYKAREQALFTELAEYFTAVTPGERGADLTKLSSQIDRDLAETYPAVLDAAQSAGDRGTQRICVWGEKVTRMTASLLSQYAQLGEAFLAEKDVWICTVCGFLYVGEAPPALCPVCKVPDWKFKKIEGRASA